MFETCVKLDRFVQKIADIQRIVHEYHLNDSSK